MYIIIVGILLITLGSAVVDFFMRSAARKDARMRMAPRVEQLLKEEEEDLKYINSHKAANTTSVVVVNTRKNP